MNMPESKTVKFKVSLTQSKECRFFSTNKGCGADGQGKASSGKKK